ncbi:MAG: hypothetical protein JAY94_04215 [Candidatus Thiodiazotropha endolucinida]|nr:hypothetical protein [Candidatus Thiodiazotropha taylori]MCW4316695.1 hypothetical protein [Candidatus Thiodiazotropha taylori]
MSNSTSDNQEIILYMIVIMIALAILGGGADRNEEKTTLITNPQNSNRPLEYKGGEASSGESTSTAKSKSYTWDDVANLKQQTLGNLDETDRLLN